MSHPINPSVNRLARPRTHLLLVVSTAVVSTFTTTSTVASAQSPTATVATTSVAQSAPTPCPGVAERHQFDFWIGDWDVTTPGGTSVGSSIIQSVSGGCALLENWTSNRGGHGKSLNTYNPARHQWQQFWIGQDGGVGEYRASEFDGKSLAFFMKDESDSLSAHRLTFTPVDAATVRQHSEVSKDGGKSWTTEYDFYYHRKAKP
jgi:hypothetical protein